MRGSGLCSKCKVCVGYRKIFGYEIKRINPVVLI